MESNSDITNIITNTDPKIQYYSVVNPVEGENVQVVFTKEENGYFKGHLVDYNYEAMINYDAITKKKRVQNFRSFIELNKNMIARVEEVDSDKSNVQLSLAYFFNGNNSKSTPDEVQKTLMVPFVENKMMESFVKTLSIVNNYSYNTIWTEFVHEVDRARRRYIDGEEENEDDEEEDHDENISIWKYFSKNSDKVDEWIGNTSLDASVGTKIKELYSKKTEEQEFKLVSKFIVISRGSIQLTKNMFSSVFKDLTYKFSCRYESAPYYLFETSSTDTTKADHETLVEMLKSKAKELGSDIHVEPTYVAKKSE